MTFPKISVELAIFEVSYPALETEPAQIPDALFGWFQNALAQIDLDVLPDLPPYGFEPDLAPVIEVLLCSRETMDMLTDEPCEGLFIVETPDGDPFNDQTPLATRMRVAVVIDTAEIEARLREGIEMDGAEYANNLGFYQENQALTAFHELAHAILFMKNGQMVSPNSLEALSDAGDLEHDLFDITTGYGMRPLPDAFGDQEWAENAADAQRLMEDWCDLQGKHWYAVAEAHQALSFFEAAGIDMAALAARAADQPSP